MSTLNQLQRLTINLPTGQFTSETEEELIYTLIDNLKREAWHFAKQTLGVSLTQEPGGLFFTIPQGMTPESAVNVMFDFVKPRWSTSLPEITFTVDSVDNQGYLV
jgi:hypothetical protein